jgi:hypothetical protein
MAWRRVPGRDVDIVRVLVAEALDQDEDARVAGIAVDVEGEHARLGARRRDQLRERRLHSGDLIVACNPAGDHEHRR